MKVLVSSHDRFCLTPDGTLWAPSPPSAYAFWTRYLARFSEVGICARAQPVEAPPDGWTQASGAGVRAVPLPSYLGPRQFVLKYPALVRAAKRAVDAAEAIILRVPSDLAGLLFDRMPRGRPFGVEAMGDPLESLSASSIRHFLQPVIRRRAHAQMRRQTATAVAAAYVAKTVLPQRYPAKAGALVTNYSSIHLPRSDFAASPRPSDAFRHRPLRLACIGTFEQLYKGQDVLLRAVRELLATGEDVQVTFAGGGKYLSDMQALAKDLGVSSHVTFAGHLAGRAPVMALMDASDLLVLPSRTEGLPRVVIEALARGLPCIGSRVGGVPELLDDASLFQPGDVPSLVRCLRAHLNDPERLAAQSRRGLEVAAEYEETTLSKRRVALYDRVAEETERWLRRQPV